MPIICWGNLAKSADDTQRIEQAIQGYVEDHNENVNAHQIEGSSLYMHRVLEQLDHKFGSVDLRHLASDKVLMVSSLESTDGWGGSGSFIPGIFAANLSTTNEQYNVANAYWTYAIESFMLAPAKNPFFQTSLFFSHNTLQHGYFGAGDVSNIFTEQGYGFKVVNGNLYACVNLAGAEYTHSISGIDITTVNVYRCEYRYSGNAIDFYVNGVLRYTETTHLITESPEPFFTYYIKTDSAAYRHILVVDLLFMQDR